ncbi:hypothetical protein MD484_g4269, partial [Candolleomyces efflorescens]
MDPVSLTTGAAFNQPNYATEAPLGHSKEDDHTTRQLGQDQALRQLEHQDADARYPVNTFAPPSSSLDQPREPVDDIPQQASTQPGDGTEVHQTATGTANVPFKERVIGVAQKTRGTLLGKPELKEHGQAILEGRTTHEKDRDL